MSDIVRDQIAAEIAAVTPLASTPADDAITYGIDLLCVSDLDARLTETKDDSYESLAQDLYHRITTDRGALIDDPDYGDNIAAYLSGDSQGSDLRSVEGRQSAEILKDDRVDTVTVALTVVSTRQWDVTYRVTPRDPALTAFSLVVAVRDGEALLEAILR